MADKKNFAEYLTDDNLIFIENEYIKIGANLSLGGALTHLSEIGGKNMINSYDWGRQVQMSFYANPTPFNPNGTMPDNWKWLGWNPIQCGDCYRNRSKIVDFKQSEDELYIKCIPMHWPLNNYPGECTFEVWYRLDGYCVNVTSRLNNARPDTTQYEARRQEMPAVYTNGEWYKGVSYVGDKPFTGDDVTVLFDKGDDKGWPTYLFYPTENWSALLNDEGRGLGVYSGINNLEKIGFYKEKGVGGPRDTNTGYISPMCYEIIDHNIVYTFDYSLIVGDLDFIRATAIEMDKGKNRKKYTFEHDRDHFYYKNITDGGFPTGGCLDFDFMPEGELISPYMFIGKNECKTVELDACFEGVVEGEIVCNIYKGIDEKSHGVTEPKALPFKLVGNGKRATFNVDISEIDESFVGFLLRFANSGHLKVYGVEIK